MALPPDIGIVDLMLDIPSPENIGVYDFLAPLLRDRESRENFEFPAEYMFKEVPREAKGVDSVEVVLDEMDRWGIDKALIGVAGSRKHQRPHIAEAMADHPHRFYGCVHVDPNDGMEALRAIEYAYENLRAKAVGIFPAGCNPQVPINDKKMYPVYAKCVELDIPVLVCAGVPGPRVPMGVQDVALIDEVCWFFPELKFETRHGCEPWTDLAVKLMLKWPNLYYSTSAFAPRYYPKNIVDYANTRGADKIMYAGYFPIGLSLERIMTERPGVGFNDDVWPKFLRDNAMRVFELDD
jgi:predicted TIM-barrel fold metal-dependent hydrolase